ncbi:hsp90 co-chaperone cdc37 [Ophiostoma piceae UAMH 11346]|uniref:Hsp90 chaperone protein kinase-targeting subunit n=1 Tax=Ophiostoma piceae (strain UAMH 11346) TaxID=1262450 RepID=S3CLE7_OPHP1|nr:hsp90 co-chaperone cdc37 [Ophiostoma piceae UAMH 11346]
MRPEARESRRDLLGHSDEADVRQSAAPAKQQAPESLAYLAPPRPFRLSHRQPSQPFQAEKTLHESRPYATVRYYSSSFRSLPTMPINYSKWDNLELSDDSDIEVHPNVDKRSFIRAKQNQIHQERQQRRHQIETLKYERIINDGLAKRISGLLESLRSHAEEARTSPAKAAEVAFRAVMESASKLKPGEDHPPKPPADVHQYAEQPESYTKMMAALLDQVNKAVEEKKIPADDGAARFNAMVEEIESHRAKVDDLQGQLIAKLAELESDESRKITSDSIHTGFDSSHVNKSAPEDKDKKGAGSGGAGSGQMELLNPNFNSAGGSTGQAAAGATDEDDDPTEPTELGRKFAVIPAKDHYQSRGFIASHPEILTERHEESILILAFDAEMDGEQEKSRQCVHQAKLLEYCRSLGRDGVQLFFKRIETREHKAYDLFYGDVRETYTKIRSRVAEIKAQQAAGSTDGGVEQIQLHAVEPGTVINIRVPPTVEQLKIDVAKEAGADAEIDPADLEAAKYARDIFEGFAPEMRQALESGSLDKVNEVLGRMKIDEAEALVGEFGEAGILSMEEEIIDATTETGRAQLKDLGRETFVDENGVSTEEPKKEVYDDPE